MAKTFAPEVLDRVTPQVSGIAIEDISAAISVLYARKREAKAELAEQAKAQKELAAAEAAENGKALAKDAKVGDIATVICGSGKFAKQFKFPIQKIGENTITVEFTEDNTPNGTTGKRYIKYEKLVAIN